MTSLVTPASDVLTRSVCRPGDVTVTEKGQRAEEGEKAQPGEEALRSTGGPPSTAAVKDREDRDREDRELPAGQAADRRKAATADTV